MTATERAIDLTITAARAAAERKALEIIALDVSEQLVLTDVFLIAAGRNERQVGAIVDSVEEAMHRAGSAPLRREGKAQGRWVLIDFGDIVVHVQHEDDREFYALERLWGDCPAIGLPEDARGGDGDTSEFEDVGSFPTRTGLYQAAEQAHRAEQRAASKVDQALGDAAAVHDAEGEVREPGAGGEPGPGQEPSTVQEPVTERRAPGTSTAQAEGDEPSGQDVL